MLVQRGHGSLLNHLKGTDALRLFRRHTAGSEGKGLPPMGNVELAEEKKEKATTAAADSAFFASAMLLLLFFSCSRRRRVGVKILILQDK